MKNKTLRSYSVRLSGGVILLFAGVVTALAQTTPSNPSSEPGGSSTPPAQSSSGKAGETALKRSDQHFFKKTARLGEEEVALSTIASQRATNPQVRAFASDIVREHTAANSELSALGERKGARFEPRDPENASKEEKKWREKKGDKFDEDYLKAIIDGHEDMIGVLKDGAESKDAEIAAWSNKLLASVQGHLAQAKALKKTVD